MKDDLTVIRQWRMLRMLGARRHGIVVGDMAHEFGVSGRTIRRDLQKLQAVGFPICETTGERGSKIWRLAENAAVPQIAFSLGRSLRLSSRTPIP